MTDWEFKTVFCFVIALLLLPVLHFCWKERNKTGSLLTQWRAVGRQFAYAIFVICLFFILIVSGMFLIKWIGFRAVATFLVAIDWFWNALDLSIKRIPGWLIAAAWMFFTLRGIEKSIHARLNSIERQLLRMELEG